MKKPSRMFRLAWFLCFMAAPLPVLADTMTLNPSADTSLNGRHSSNNHGGNGNFIAGTVAQGQNTRALIQFDVAGSIPAGSTINSVTLDLNLTRAAAGPGSTFGLHRVLVSWGEGNKTGNRGLAPSAGESTWVHRHFDTDVWGVPGGQAGTDYMSTASGSLPISFPGAYQFASSAGLVADVQTWLDQPNDNYGWIMISQLEGVPRTSRRFASREAAAGQPALTIDFTPPPPPFEITQFGVNNGNLEFAWINGNPPFQVQGRPTFNEPWQNVGSPTQDRTASVPMSEDQSYFRVIEAVLPDDTAAYRLTFQGMWTSQSHPQNRPGAPHFSRLVGGTHNGQVVFWQTNMMATEGIKNMAELGATSTLINEVDFAIESGTAEQGLVGPPNNSGSGTVTMDFEVTVDYPLATVVTMLAPSPDWFLGVSGLSLLGDNGDWVDEVSVPLYLFDAGTDSGPSYESGNQATVPPEPISLITGFPSLVNDTLTPFGTFTFTRLPEIPSFGE